MEPNSHPDNGTDNNNIYTYDHIYGAYISLMRKPFNAYIQDRVRHEAELEVEHRDSRDRCLTYLTESDGDDYRQDAQRKLDQEFRQFLDYCAHYKKCFEHFLSRLGQFLAHSPEYWDRRTLLAECGQTIHEVYMAFDQNIPFMNDGLGELPTDTTPTTAPTATEDNYFRAFGYDFRLVLTQHMEQHIRRFEVLAGYLLAGCQSFGPKLTIEYGRQSFGRRYLNSSNEWLHADNKVYVMARDELSRQSRKYWHRFGEGFQRRLESDTRRTRDEMYASARKGENFAVGMCLLAGAVGVGVALALDDYIGAGVMLLVAILAVVYFGVRQCVRPKDLRGELSASDHGVMLFDDDTGASAGGRADSESDHDYTAMIN